MKYIKYYSCMMVGLLALLTACTSDLMEQSPSQSSQEITTTDETEYSISLPICLPSYQEQNIPTRSQTYGNEGIERSEDMKLFCFDKYGFFLGLAKEVTIEATMKDEIKDDGSSDLKGLKAIVPNATARLHFVANATNDFSHSTDWIGVHENNLMTSFESSAGEEQSQKIVYWGYVKKNSPAEMKAFLEGGNTHNVVHLIRDRAKVKVELDEKVAADISHVIVSIYDGQEHGTVAPFKKNLTFPETNEMKEWNAEDITPTRDRKTYEGSEGQMENVAYTFENYNDADKPLKVILKVTYKDGTTKRFLVLLQDQENKLYRIKRNHVYKIRVKKLDPALGYDSFDAAVNGTPANNPWIVVEDIVPEVSDGKYTLSITDGTYLLLNEGASSEQSVRFKYIGDATISAEDFEASWVKNTNCGTPDAPTITFENGDGKVHFGLSTIEDDLKEGIIRLLDKKHGLSRNIHIYTIKQLDYQFEFPQYMGKDQDATATLKFQIPSNYPEELLPIEISIASNDVNPQGCSVVVSSTADVDGGKNWNCWFVEKYESDDVIGTTQSITIKNVRTNQAGTKGKFYIKANYYKGDYQNESGVITQTKEFAFTYQ